MSTPSKQAVEAAELLQNRLDEIYQHYGKRVLSTDVVASFIQSAIDASHAATTASDEEACFQLYRQDSYIYWLDRGRIGNLGGFVGRAHDDADAQMIIDLVNPVLRQNRAAASQPQEWEVIRDSNDETNSPFGIQAGDVVLIRNLTKARAHRVASAHNSTLPASQPLPASVEEIVKDAGRKCYHEAGGMLSTSDPNLIDLYASRFSKIIRAAIAADRAAKEQEDLAKPEGDRAE